jgi:hypothetical protein
MNEFRQTVYPFGLFCDVNFKLMMVEILLSKIKIFTIEVCK